MTVRPSREGIYIGESSRSLHERAVEHVKDAQAFSAKSHIVKHWMASHPSLPTPPKMDFTITAKFKDCLSRQIGEALHISFSRDTLLNSKAEYLSNSVSRLTVKEDAWVLKERQRVEDEEEETNKKKVDEFRMQKATAHTTQPTHETATVHVEEPCKNGGKTAKQNLNLQPQVMDIVYSQASQMEVGDIKTTEEGESSVNTLTGTECNTIYETDDEEFEDKLVSTAREEGSVNTLTGTACNTIYETDEEEFARDARDVKTVETVKVAHINHSRKKRKRSSKERKNQGYQLAYLNLWWSRMVREANKDEKESRRKEERQEKKEMAKKWFQPEPEQRLKSEGYSESRSRRDNDDVWMLPQQDEKHWFQDNSTTEGMASEFNGGNSTEGKAGEVSENECIIYEQTQDNNLRVNMSVLNTSRVRTKTSELSVIEASQGMRERESNTKLRN